MQVVGTLQRKICITEHVCVCVLQFHLTLFLLFFSASTIHAAEELLNLFTSAHTSQPLPSFIGNWGRETEGQKILSALAAKLTRALSSTLPLSSSEGGFIQEG